MYVIVLDFKGDAEKQLAEMRLKLQEAERENTANHANVSTPRR